MVEDLGNDHAIHTRGAGMKPAEAGSLPHHRRQVLWPGPAVEERGRGRRFREGRRVRSHHEAHSLRRGVEHAEAGVPVAGENPDDDGGVGAGGHDAPTVA